MLLIDFYKALCAHLDSFSYHSNCGATGIILKLVRQFMCGIMKCIIVITDNDRQYFDPSFSPGVSEMEIKHLFKCAVKSLYDGLILWGM